MAERAARRGERRRGAHLRLGALLALSGALLAAGLFLPAITLGPVFFAERVSLAGAVFGFAAAGQWFLFLITFAFTVAFPLAKVAVCLALWATPRRPGGAAAVRLAGWLAALSRWSMVDVFIVALVVLAVDGRVFGAADIHAGVIVFSAGVLLSTWAARRTVATAGESS